MAQDGAGADVGQVVLQERTEAGMTATAAPIDAETTLRARTWARMKADGTAATSSPAGVELLLHPGASASATVIADGEVDASAQGMATASDAMTKVYAAMGTSLDPSTRASLMANAAATYAMARYQGASGQAATSDYEGAALDAFVGSGADLAMTAAASAAAASTFDAQLHGQVSARGRMVSNSVLLNLRARERLAAQFEDAPEGSVAVEIRDALTGTEDQVWASGSSATQIRAALDAGAQATTEATVGAMLDLLVPNAGAILRGDVQAKAEAAVEAARMDTRLNAAADADAAAQAMAAARSEVHAAVQAMLEAAGRTDLNVDTMTSLYIAAHGGAFVRAS